MNLPFPKSPRRLALALAASSTLALAGCQSALAPAGRVASTEIASSTGVGYLSTIRSSAGLSGLAPDSKLERAALEQARLMARSDRMAHTTGPGTDFRRRMKAGGISGAAAENIARGAMPEEKLFSMWMASSGHRRNMLDARFSKFGLAYATRADDPARRYWALVLGE